MVMCMAVTLILTNCYEITNLLLSLKIRPFHKNFILQKLWSHTVVIAALIFKTCLVTAGKCGTVYRQLMFYEQLHLFILNFRITNYDIQKHCDIEHVRVTSCKTKNFLYSYILCITYIVATIYVCMCTCPSKLWQYNE